MNWMLIALKNPNVEGIVLLVGDGITFETYLLQVR